MLKNIAAFGAAALLAVGAAALPAQAQDSGGAAKAQHKPLFIKKVLHLPETGVTTPDVTFKFEFTPDRNNSKIKEPKASAFFPSLSGLVGYSSADSGDDLQDQAGKQLVKATDNILKTATFTHGDGEYVYTVKEDITTEQISKEDGQVDNKCVKAPSGETFVCSKAEYVLSLIVEGGVVTDIQLKKTKDDKGTDLTKVEPKPAKETYQPGNKLKDGESGGSDSSADDGTGKNNGFAFNNYYEKIANPVTEYKDKPSTVFKNPDDKGKVNEGGPGSSGVPGVQPSLKQRQGLVLSKFVTGTDRPDSKTKKFGFSFTVTAPEVGAPSAYDAPEGNAKYKYYIAKAGENPTDDTFKDGEYGKKVENVELAHGEQVVFVNIKMGSKVVATETDHEPYTVSVKAEGTISVNDVTALGKTGIVLNDADNSSKAHNHIAFTNSAQTPVGVLLNMLPFIMLFLVGGVGVAYYVHSRRKAETV